MACRVRIRQTGRCSSKAKLACTWMWWHSQRWRRLLNSIDQTKKNRLNYFKQSGMFPFTVLFSCETARDTEVRMFIVYSGASVHNTKQEELELRYNGHFEKVQKNICDLPRPGSSANKRVRTSFFSWSRSVRNSAITRWNASDSIASSALLKTLIFIWVENGETPQLTKNGKSITCTSRCIKIVIIFQQHCVFNIEMKGSV